MRKNITDAESLLPLMPTEFEILMSLVDEQRHGYGIMTEVKERTGGRVVLGAGTLYGTIKRLRKQRLLEESASQPDEGAKGERRRYYRLTSTGLALARAEAIRLSRVVNDARAKKLITKRV